MVYWRKNIFMVPTGAADKKFISGIARILNFWNSNTSLENILLKATDIVPTLFL